MRKNIKLSLLIVLILIIVCTVVVVWNPIKNNKVTDYSSSTTTSQTTGTSLSTSSGVELSSQSADVDQLKNSGAAYSSSLFESSILIDESSLENSEQFNANNSEISDLVAEDQPEAPDLNFETSGSSYDDIMVNILTCLLSQDMSALSEYVGSVGFRLAPTGIFSAEDVVLSASDLSAFFSLSAQKYGTYPGSGESIYLTPTEYYNSYLVPSGFDFSAASVSYNDSADLAAVAGYVSDPKTVSYLYSPNVMEWKRLIVVYTHEGGNDVLSGIIYQDVTTN